MYKSLQAFRALAATSVVLFHLGATFALEKYYGAEWLSFPSYLGYVGVECFFVLSGFTIVTAHRHEMFQLTALKRYTIKRVLRIFPTYWIIFLSVYFTALLIPSFSGTVPHDLLLILKSLTLIPLDKNIVGGTGAPVIIVAWSLQYEMLFYVLFSLLFLSKKTSLISVVVLLGLIVFFGSEFQKNFILSSYVLLFFMGGGAALVARNQSSNKRLLLGFFVAIGIIVVTVYYRSLGIIVEGPRVFMLGCSFALIIFFLVNLEANGIVIGGGRTIQLIGSASYVLYLLHFPMISILSKLSLSIFGKDVPLIGILGIYIGIFLICLISSIIFHKVIELKINNWLSEKLLRRKG
jgi:peptidoglycan/LPS O-acetylase OafA/YrhL